MTTEQQTTEQTENDKEASGPRTRKSIIKRINPSDNNTDCELTTEQQTDNLDSVDDFSEPCKNGRSS